MWRGKTGPRIIDTTTIEFTPEEQFIRLAQQFSNLDCSQFLVRSATGEGSIANALSRASIADLDAGRSPDEVQPAIAQAQLRQRDGVPAVEILNEIWNRQVKPALKPPRQNAILEQKEEAAAEPERADTLSLADKPGRQLYAERSEYQERREENLTIAVDRWNPVGQTLS